MSRVAVRVTSRKILKIGDFLGRGDRLAIEIRLLS